MVDAGTFSIAVSVLLATAALARMADPEVGMPERAAYAFAAIMFILAAATRLIAVLS